VNPANLITSLQSNALAHEVERQLKNETSAVIAAAERDARTIVAQARAAARGRVRAAITELRREGASRLARATAQLDTEQRARAQWLAAQAVSDAVPLLRDELEARWRDPQNRRQWTDAVARLCVLRLRPSAWRIEHPPDWSEPEQRDFTATIGERDGVETNFKADGDLKSGLRNKTDQAVFHATPQGLLADCPTIAPMKLDEIEQ